MEHKNNVAGPERNSETASEAAPHCFQGVYTSASGRMVAHVTKDNTIKVSVGGKTVELTPIQPNRPPLPPATEGQPLVEVAFLNKRRYSLEGNEP